MVTQYRLTDQGYEIFEKLIGARALRVEGINDGSPVDFCYYLKNLELVAVMNSTQKTIITYEPHTNFAHKLIKALDSFVASQEGVRK